MVGRFPTDFGFASEAVRLPVGLGSQQLVGAVHMNITEEVVDQVVDSTLRDSQLEPEATRVFKHLLAADPQSSVAKAYYHGVAGAGIKSALRLAKTRLEIPYVLSDVQVVELTNYARDFQLSFDPRESHDHPMAAACRMVDRAVVYSRVPVTAKVSDVGAAAIPLVNSGMLGGRVHACSPVVDPKDPARSVLVRRRLVKIAASGDEVKADAARSWLAGDPTVVCGKRVQDCAYQTPAVTSIHVYDVPMEDWAAVMDYKKVEVVEGCLLFPRDIFKSNSGVMAVAGARYEADYVARTFRMGFVGSPSWWYKHDLMDYLRYGVDQVLCAGGSTYSYKVVERRGDTLFFRILKVHPLSKPNFRQVYKMPGIPMVEVLGFPMRGVQDKASLWSFSKVKYTFPAALWEDMLSFAKDCVERNVLTHERMYNYYRTVAPRQSINSVIVSGGFQVADINQMIPLITHVVLFAFLEVRKAQMNTAGVIASVNKCRHRADEWTIYKVVAAYARVLELSLGCCFYPLIAISEFWARVATKAVQTAQFTWNLAPVVKMVPVELVLPKGYFPPNPELDESDLMSSLDDDVVHGDWFGYLQECRDLIPRAVAAFPELADDLEAFEFEVEQEPLIELDSDGDESVSQDLSQATYVPVSSVEVLRRQNSIREAILECESESAQCEASCSDHYSQLMVLAKPNLVMMAERREMMFNPQFWWVDKGVLSRTLDGSDVREFVHSAVYIPYVTRGSCLYEIEEQEFSGMSQGIYVDRVHYTIDLPEYTGWAYANDSLLIYNGPAIAEALSLALNKSLDFSVTLCQGPPGCGKTTAIVDRCQLDDIVLVPVRKSARETADRLKSKSLEYAGMVKDRVRTLDSYLVNCTRRQRVRSLASEVLLADECFMAREGRWLAAAALLGVSRVYAYGDQRQIPHVVRAACPDHHVRLQHSVMQETYLSYRCPASAVAGWGSEFGWRVRSAASRVGTMEHVQSTVGREIPDGCVMMGMYQADKKQLQKMYQGRGRNLQIMTVHESQGNTYESVWLHRFDMRKRIDKFSLYDKAPYALVAMSRHTKDFLYVSPKLGDQVQVWLERAKDPRRITAASDIATAGVVKEFA